MKEKFVKSVKKSGTSLAINIPSEIVKLMKIMEGDFLRVEIEKINSKQK
jgi:antitoxin component of MazEF toxin-antitoxin module